MRGVERCIQRSREDEAVLGPVPAPLNHDVDWISRFRDRCDVAGRVGEERRGAWVSTWSSHVSGHLPKDVRFLLRKRRTRWVKHHPRDGRTCFYSHVHLGKLNRERDDARQRAYEVGERGFCEVPEEVSDDSDETDVAALAEVLGEESREPRDRVSDLSIGGEVGVVREVEDAPIVVELASVLVVAEERDPLHEPRAATRASKLGGAIGPTASKTASSSSSSKRHADTILS